MQCTILREEMMEVLYGEADADTQRRVSEHQLVCADCRGELTAFRGLRRSLDSWADPGFGRTRLPRRAWGLGRGLAAAAAVVFLVGGGLVVSGSEVRYQDGRLSVRLGREDLEVRRLLAEQEARHQSEIANLRAQLAQYQPAAGHDDRALLAKVQDMIHDSETRQAVLLSTNLSDLSERSDAQRQFDLAQMKAGLSYLDQQNGQQFAKATELIGYAFQASQQK
jgi:hypothetical protein